MPVCGKGEKFKQDFAKNRASEKTQDFWETIRGERGLLRQMKYGIVHY